MQNKAFSLDYNQKIIVSQLMSYVSKYGKKLKGSLESYIGLFEEAAEYSQYVCLYLYRLFLLLDESDSIVPVSGDADSVVFAKTVKYMNAMACQMIAVEDFASYANVSVSKLKRIF